MLSHQVRSKVFRVGVLAVILCALAVSVVGCGAGTQQATSATPQVAQEPQKWEYKTLLVQGVAYGPFSGGSCGIWESDCMEEDGYSATNQKLRELGLEGWELVGFTYNPGEIQTVFVFKRPID
jgi:hypothetical protein